MKHGAAWVIFEESHNKISRKLLSLLSIRQSAHSIRRHIEQMYVDRYGSIETKIIFKKSKKSLHLTVFQDPFSNIIHCGDDPWICAIPAHSISLKNEILSFNYRIAVDKSNVTNPRFEDRTQTIRVQNES